MSEPKYETNHGVRADVPAHGKEHKPTTNIAPVAGVSHAKGWDCPKCGKAHGPAVKTCREVK
jgi:predicted RNA-binding Zn-ribbon protein involved in translation (DUF1610 family)